MVRYTDTSDSTYDDDMDPDETTTDGMTSWKSICDDTSLAETISDDTTVDDTSPVGSFLDNIQCLHTLQEHWIDWSEVEPSDDFQASTSPEDARATMPQNESELHALQLAIRPTFDDFAYITKSEPIVPNPWLSYNDQVNFIQKQLTQLLKDAGHEEMIWLPRLEPWNSRLDSDEIWKRIQSRVSIRDDIKIVDDTPKKLRKRRGKVSLEWARAKEVPRVAQKMQVKLLQPSLREPWKGDPDVDNAQEARLNKLVANDGPAYTRWLTALGFMFYESQTWGKQGKESWEFWCHYIAPSIFVLDGKLSTREPMVNVKFGPSVELVRRPVISLDDARRGHRAYTMPKGRDRVSLDAGTFLPALKRHNPVLAPRNEDLADYGVERTAPCFNDDTETTTVKRKRKSNSEGITKPVKRIYFKDTKAPKPIAEEITFIEPGLLLIDPRPEPLVSP